VLSAIELVGEGQKHFVTFVDLMSTSRAGPEHLPLYDVTGGQSSFFVYHKPL
jgi:hypothetical protein